MIKANDEIKNVNDVRSIIEASDVCRLGLYANGEVYIVPMNFGYEISDEGTLTLYFHCANKGRKLDMIAENPEVCFEMDIAKGYIPSETEEACYSSFNFASLIGNGSIEILKEDDDRVNGLTILMKKYSSGSVFQFNEKILALTTVLRLTSDNYSIKLHNK